MSDNKIYIKFNNHFKLYVLLKYKSTFESALIENNIDFYYDINEQAFGDSIRYFLLSKDKKDIDSIITEKGIIANLEQNLVDDFEQAGSEFKFKAKAYILAVIAILLLAIIALMFEKW